MCVWSADGCFFLKHGVCRAPFRGYLESHNDDRYQSMRHVKFSGKPFSVKCFSSVGVEVGRRARWPQW